MRWLVHCDSNVEVGIVLIMIQSIEWIYRNTSHGSADMQILDNSDFSGFIADAWGSSSKCTIHKLSFPDPISPAYSIDHAQELSNENFEEIKVLITTAQDSQYTLKQGSGTNTRRTRVNVQTL